MTRIEIQLDLGENDYDPRRFVDAAVYAEQLGFRTAWFGDHIFPWFHSGKRASFVWSVLSVALDRTDRIKVGPAVTVPVGARYHPAIVAQAAATIDNMYPGRLLLGVGTGEAFNERPFWSGKWPRWEERMERLIEGIKLIRMMWDSKEPFKFEGKYFSSDFYYLYTKPRREIPIYFSAIGRRAARHAGTYGDNLITLCPRNDLQTMKQVILPAYRQGRTDAAKTGPGGAAVWLGFSFKKPQDLVRTEWRTLAAFRKNSWSIPTPVAAEQEGKKVTADDLRRSMHFCKKWEDVVRLIEGYSRIGINAYIIPSGADSKKIHEIAENLLKVF